MELDPEKIRQQYNDLEGGWPKDDWHKHTYQRIWEFICSAVHQYPDFTKGSILNAGSGGNSYGIESREMIHLDIAEKPISLIPNSIVGSIEKIPLPDHHVMSILCAGSVINYCDVFRGLSEFRRVLRPLGYLIFDYESSDSFEFFGTPHYRNSAAVVSTFFNHKEEQIWIYSDSHMRNLLNHFGFEICITKRVHLLSPLVYRLTGSDRLASSFTFLDGLAKRLPYFRSRSTNVFLVCQKRDQTMANTSQGDA